MRSAEAIKLDMSPHLTVVGGSTIPDPAAEGDGRMQGVQCSDENITFTGEYPSAVTGEGTIGFPLSNYELQGSPVSVQTEAGSCRNGEMDEVGRIITETMLMFGQYETARHVLRMVEPVRLNFEPIKTLLAINQETVISH